MVKYSTLKRLVLTKNIFGACFCSKDYSIQLITKNTVSMRGMTMSMTGMTMSKTKMTMKKSMRLLHRAARHAHRHAVVLIYKLFATYVAAIAIVC